MTERLYLIDSHLFENECTVLACTPAKEGFDVTVDKTVVNAVLNDKCVSS